MYKLGTEKNWNMYRIPFTLCIVGALLLMVAIVLALGFPAFFEHALKEELILRPDSGMLKSFEKTPIPLYFQVWLFNVTNAKQVLQGGKPILDEIGPYTYRMQKEQVNVRFNHTSGTISSQGKTFYYFQPDSSAGNESDIITTINPIFITLAAKASEGTMPFLKGILQMYFMRFNLVPYVTRSVGELLFRGYDEPLLKELAKVTKIEAHKFGFFYGKNGTLEDKIEIMTGELGMSDYQNIVNYDGKEELNYWSEKRCNMLNGSLGYQVTRPIITTKPLYLFSVQLCRSIYALYEKETTLGPLNLQRFVLPMSLFERKEENNCFCPSNFTCRPSMLDISACQDGLPIVISTPHFMGGDSLDINAVEGLNPVKDHHETFLDIEPNTGVTVRAFKRMQVNMPLRKYGDFPLLINVTELIHPILWINESAVVDMETVNKLYFILTVPKAVVKYGSFCFLLTGLLLVLVACIDIYKVYKKNKSISNRNQELTIRDKVFEVTNNTKLLANEMMNYK